MPLTVTVGKLPELVDEALASIFAGPASTVVAAKTAKAAKKELAPFILAKEASIISKQSNAKCPGSMPALREEKSERKARRSG